MTYKMKLSAEAKQIKQVPEGFICNLTTYRRLFDFVKSEYLEDYKDWDDYSILEMIRIESKLARR